MGPAPLRPDFFCVCLIVRGGHVLLPSSHRLYWTWNNAINCRFMMQWRENIHTSSQSASEECSTTLV